MRKHLTFANVCSLLALFIALGTGAAYAANTVFSSDIVNGEVKSVDIGNNQVQSPDVKNQGLTGADIADQSGVDTCTGGVRVADMCVRAENFDRDFFDARNHCANISMRQPTLGEAREMVQTHDIPDVDESEFFWTDERTPGSTTEAVAVADDGTFNSALAVNVEVETVCVTTPTN